MKSSSAGPASPPPLQPSITHVDGRQVLLVEDETRLRDMLTRAIHEMAFRPTAAPSGEAALRQLEQRTFDVLIVDLNLPGMSGLELLETVRKRWPATQVIILTGFGDLEAAKRAIHLDVVDFLTKPCALGHLEVALDRARQRRVQAVHGDAAAAAVAPEVTVPQFDPSPAPASSLSLEQMEQRHILAVLEKNHGNRSATAAELGISLRKLYYRLGQYQKMGLLSHDK